MATFDGLMEDLYEMSWPEIQQKNNQGEDLVGGG